MYCSAAEAELRNPAAVLYGPNDLRFEEHDLAEEIAPGHVRVQMRAVGICGSDVHFYKKVCLQLRTLEDIQNGKPLNLSL